MYARCELEKDEKWMIRVDNFNNFSPLRSTTLEGTPRVNHIASRSVVASRAHHSHSERFQWRKYYILTASVRQLVRSETKKNMCIIDFSSPCPKVENDPSQLVSFSFNSFSTYAALFFTRRGDIFIVANRATWRRNLNYATYHGCCVAAISLNYNVLMVSSQLFMT